MSTKQTEALKLAMEALEECRRDPRLKYEHPYYDKTIDAIREALTDCALERMAENARELGLDYEPAQQPVAMRYDFDGYGYKYIDAGSGSDWQTRIKDAEPVYASPQPAQQQEHITDGTPCWCNPVLDYKDPDTGAEVWIHKEPQ